MVPRIRERYSLGDSVKMYGEVWFDDWSVDFTDTLYSIGVVRRTERYRLAYAIFLGPSGRKCGEYVRWSLFEASEEMSPGGNSEQDFAAWFQTGLEDGIAEYEKVDSSQDGGVPRYLMTII
jgi:hypothetical protein